MKRTETVLIFLVKDKQVLLSLKKRGHGKGNLNGAGGKVDPGESIKDAAVREVREELSVQVELSDLLPAGLLHFTQEPYIDLYSNVDAHLFLCRKWLGEPKESDELLPQWFEQSVVPYDRMWADDQYWLPAILDGEQVEGWFDFDVDYNLLSHKLKILAG